MKTINIDYEGLTNFLKSLRYEDFGDLIKKGNSIKDIEYFRMDKSKITLDTVIFYNKPFLLDSVGNDLTVAVLTKRRYKNPTGRVVGFKHIKTLINNCRSYYGSSISGYWIIPDKFIIEND